MARKGWNALSANYRSRLEKAGISQSDYEAGQSIKAARGHSKTPERPTQANPRQHAAYLSERKRLTDLVVRHKNAYFNTAPKWNPDRAKRPFMDNPPPLAKLRYWATLSKEEWIDAIREDGDATAFLGYH